MNLNRYEKIDGREALKRLADGENVYANQGYYQLLDSGDLMYVPYSGRFIKDDTKIPLSSFVKEPKYIPKPFDVRQAMLDRPNEWVGAYNDGVGWWAVGFDLNHCCVVSKQIPISYPVDAEYAGTDFPKPEQLNICIPIEDVPEEVKR